MEEELVDVTCHRCGHEFVTRASARTTCRECRAAVTVRREGVTRTPRRATDDIELPLGVGGVVALVVAVGLWLWSAWGRSD